MEARIAFRKPRQAIDSQLIGAALSLLRIQPTSRFFARDWALLTSSRSDGTRKVHIVGLHSGAFADPKAITLDPG